VEETVEVVTAVGGTGEVTGEETGEGGRGVVGKVGAEAEVVTAVERMVGETVEVVTAVGTVVGETVEDMVEVVTVVVTAVVATVGETVVVTAVEGEEAATGMESHPVQGRKSRRVR
jgi:hypothetical protein